MSREYDIKDKSFKCNITWTDVDGNNHEFNSEDPETCETVLGLLTGNINLEDLKP